MPHLVRPFEDESLIASIQRLRAVHDFLTACAGSAVPPSAAPDWGTCFKRIEVSLDRPTRPDDIGKSKERLAEVINMAATLERLLGALQWFALHDRFRSATVAHCHPSTSDAIDANDLCLQVNGEIVARIEVCDIVSSSADGNGKEASSLKKLGCSLAVPTGLASFWLVTSPEFASYINRLKRRWPLKHYRYQTHEAGDEARTMLLQIVPNISSRFSSPNSQKAVEV